MQISHKNMQISQLKPSFLESVQFSWFYDIF